MESDSNLFDPPPPYEQSVASATAPPDLSPDDSLTIRDGRGPESIRTEEIPVPTLAPTHAPSAPPLTLLRVSSGRPESSPANEQPNHWQHTSSSTLETSTQSSLNSQERRRSKQVIRSKAVSGSTTGVNLTSGPRATQASSSLGAVHTNQSEHQYPQRTFSTDTHQRTTRRLQHKEALARHGASAPQLSSTSHGHGPEHRTPALPLSQSVIPAPPPRLLYFRSRDPSAVPACPFLLCQKQIAFTKTRRERGVTVWIACGLLFLCNTYWTTQSVMAHFRPPSRDREAILKGEGAEWASRSFSVQGEASHLLRGMLGFKTYRYQDSSFQQHRRHLAGLQRPTIATVGVLQDEQSTLMVVLGFCFVAVMAIIRWWLCLTPLLVRPLFDTVHSCPHQHPYPFPEELEQEQAMIDQELLRQQEAKKNKKGGKGNEKNDHNEPAVQAAAIAETGNSEKKRLQALEEEPDIDTTREATNSPSISEDQQETSETRKGRRAINTAETLEGEADRTLSSSSRAGSTKGLEQRGMAKKTEETVPVIKRLPWRMRRALRKAEARRLKMVTSSQDIGRYSLFYELGAVLFMDRWKQTVLMLGQTRLEADED